MKKRSRDIHPRNIPTIFEKDPKIGCRVTGVDGRTDRPTDRPTDRRRAMAIGPVDLKICNNLNILKYLFMHKLQQFIVVYSISRCCIQNTRVL